MGEAIVCISAAYSGIFQAAGLLDTARAGIARTSRRITPFGAMLCTAVAASLPDLKSAPNVVQ